MAPDNQVRHSKQQQTVPVEVTTNRILREADASFLSRLTFQWLTPLISVRKGYKHPLERADIWTILPERESNLLSRRGQSHFEELVRQESNHPLFWVLCHTFRTDLLCGGIFRLVADVLQIAGPSSLRYLLQYVTDVYNDRRLSQSEHHPLRNGVRLTIGISLMLVSQSFCQNHSTYFGSMCGAQSRAALVPIIFEKPFQLSPRAKKIGQQEETNVQSTPRLEKENPRPLAKKTAWADGRIVNLLSMDTSRIDTACIQLHLVWTTLISLCLTLALLILNITYSALAGFGLLVAALPILTYALRFLLRRRKVMNEIADQRVSLTHEILWLSFWVSNKFAYFSLSQYVGVYVGLGAAQFILFFTYGWSTTRIGTRASNQIFNKATVRVMGAPVVFFETTPVGRIVNRFARDLDVMDSTHVEAIRICGMTITNVLSALILTIVFYYYFAIALVPFIGMVCWIALYYRASARELKRFESILRASVTAKFSEALTGVPSIRAYGVQNQFFKGIRAAVDDMNGAYFLTIANQRWLSIRLDSLGNTLFFVSAMLVVTDKFNVSPSIAGLILSTLLPVIRLLQSMVRQFAEVDNTMISTDRLIHYSTKIEEDDSTVSSTIVPPSWPAHGEIKFDNVSMRYRPNLPLALNSFTLHIRAGEHIGIVGRTGAGKSSILATLFRHATSTSGTVTIDGLNTMHIPLATLRSRMAIIPQDPALFQGTIRANLDPFNSHIDYDLLSALAQAGAKTSQFTLSNPVDEDGVNFSLGQRQLLALARALVRNSAITVCDEATSSIDEDTDLVVQKTIAAAFRGRTQVCVAHRLRIVLGYDRVVVVDLGSVVELGTPLELFEREGVVWGMCVRSGVGRGEVVRGQRGEGEV